MTNTPILVVRCMGKCDGQHNVLRFQGGGVGSFGRGWCGWVTFYRCMKRSSGVISLRKARRSTTLPGKLSARQRGETAVNTTTRGVSEGKSDKTRPVVLRLSSAKSHGHGKHGLPKYFTCFLSCPMWLGLKQQLRCSSSSSELLRTSITPEKRRGP